MTEIVFKYNPILVRADITIEGDEIAKTSNLYRYRNTPLEDWVDVLIPELVDYSNDDNIRIEICSLQKYIDEINKAIRAYEKKHRHVDIEVVETPSTGYKGRLNKLSQIIEQVNESDSDLSASDVYPLDVIVVSMATEDEYEEVLERIYPGLNAKSDQALLISAKECEEDGFEITSYEIKDIDDRHIDTRVMIFPLLNECSNKYWRLLKEKVNGDGDYVLISVLNSKPKKNDELLDYIAEQLEKKGKINKSRFVFISDNPEDNLDYIQDEYGVKLNEVFDYDNADEAIEKVKYYTQNVCYVRKITELSARLKCQLEALQESITREAERNKSVAELDSIMIAYKNAINTIVNHYKTISLVTYGDFSSKNASDEFIDILTENIKNMVVEEVIKVMSDYKDGKSISNTFESILYGKSLSTLGISVAYDLLALFGNGSKAEEVEALTEATLSEYLNLYLTNHLSLEARKETGVAEGMVLQKTYSVQPFIEDKIDELCKKYVKRLSGIEKKSESGKKMGFFEWVTENISRTDIGLYSYSRSYLDYENNDYSEVAKKIKRRIKTIETNIELIFTNAFKELEFNNGADILEQKIQKIESMTNESAKRLEEKSVELIKQMEISNEDKGRINNLDILISELEKIISL